MPSVSQHCISYTTIADSGGVFGPPADSGRTSQWDMRPSTAFDINHFHSKDVMVAYTYDYDNGEPNGSITVMSNGDVNHKYHYGFGIIDLSQSVVG